MLILVLLIITILGLFTIFNLDTQKRAWFIIPFIVIYAVWAISNFAFLRIVDYQFSLFFAKISFALLPLLVWGIALLIFHIPITIKDSKLIQPFILLLGVFAVIQSAFILLTDNMITGLVYSDQLEKYTVIFDFSHFYHYIIYVLFTIFFALFVLYLKHGNSKGYIYSYLQYLFWFCVLGVVGLIFTNLFLPILLGVYVYLELGAFLALSVVFTLIYGLTIDSSSTFKESFQDILSWCIKVFYMFIGISIFFILAIFFIYESFPPLLDEIVFLILLVSFLIAYVTRNIGNRGMLLECEKSPLFVYLEDKIALELRVEKLCFLIAKYIKSALGVLDVLVLVFDQQNRDFVYKAEGGDFKKKVALNTNKLLDLVDFWQSLSTEKILLKTDLRVLELKSEGKTKEEIGQRLQFMDKYGIEAIVPLNRRVVLNGMIFIGKKTNGLDFNSQDCDLLGKIVRLGSLAFSRAILYQEVNESSDVLQKQVEGQTAVLNQKVKKMEDMRRRERDLISIMGHELRTPLTIAKNSIEMLESYKADMKKEGVKWDKNFEKYFTYLKAAIQRESGIVETLLAATKIDAGRIEAHFGDVDLVSVIQNTKLALEKDALEKGLKFKIEMDKRKKWVVKADLFRTQQVVDNVVSNAVKYTHKGEVKISLRDEKKEIGFFVSDTGEGISDEDLKYIGEKFYRAKPYIGGDGKRKDGLVRPGGTGLGLYVVFGLIKLMKARYEIESKEGKGTTFRVFFTKA